MHDYVALSETKRNQLWSALRRHASGETVLLMNPKDTSFAGEADRVPEGTQAIVACSKVPCHY